MEDGLTWLARALEPETGGGKMVRKVMVIGAGLAVLLFFPLRFDP